MAFTFWGQTGIASISTIRGNGGLEFVVIRQFPVATNSVIFFCQPFANALDLGQPAIRDQASSGSFNPSRIRAAFA